MSNKINSQPNEVFTISELAKEKRRHFDVGMLPVGDNIFKLIRKEGIYLIYSPVEIDTERDNNFSAMFVSLNEGSKTMNFVALNTADFLDKQIFALAHELYHYFEKSSLHMCRLTDGGENSGRELNANRFAAEFLLPTEKLEIEIKEVNNGDLDINEWKYSAVLRFLARLHCEYRLPYKAIVRRLLEIGAIKKELFERLYAQDVRSEENEYYHIGISMDEDVFRMLNTQKHKFGVDANSLETIFKNYEDALISISELAQTLSIFNKSLSDFGMEEEVDASDLEELGEYY